MSSLSRQRPLAVLCTVAGSLALASIWTTPTTSSYLYDLETMRGSLGATFWESDSLIPAACGDPDDYDEIVYGRQQSDDPLPVGGSAPPPGNKGNQPKPQPTNHRQIILGLGGDDVIYGGNAKDCLVGGDGDDTIYGNNGSDIILGGRGEDTLYGDNGPDDLDGGEGDDYLNGGKGPDDCVGGDGVDALVGCNDPGDPDEDVASPSTAKAPGQASKSGGFAGTQSPADGDNVGDADEPGAATDAPRLLDGEASELPPETSAEQPDADSASE
jgi:hypothetical protein